MLVPADGAPPLVVDQPLDLELGRRWRATVRRVFRVEFLRDGADLRAIVSGLGARLPFRKSVPVEVAIGLAADGVPASIADSRTT